MVRNAAISPRIGSRAEPSWVFQIFVLEGNAPHSARAVTNLRRVLDDRLPGGYELSVVDLREQPEVAAREQLIVIPAAIRRRPDPPVRLAGDFSDEARVVQAFGLEAAPPAVRGSTGGGADD